VSGNAPPTARDMLQLSKLGNVASVKKAKAEANKIENVNLPQWRESAREFYRPPCSGCVLISPRRLKNDAVQLLWGQSKS
jgi:hypothetical protein